VAVDAEPFYLVISERQPTGVLKAAPAMAGMKFNLKQIENSPCR
jgi:hypothetical protein